MTHIPRNMFTGIIQEKGILQSIQATSSGKKITILAPKTSKKMNIGDSLAVDGVCLTVTEKKKDTLFFDVVQETLKKTNFNDKKEKSLVNLEAALTLQDMLSGHLLLGHIDETGKVETITKRGKGLEIEIQYSKNIGKFIATKGCIAMNGTSLTIKKKGKRSFSIAVIPHTAEQTTLGQLQKGDKVNIEIDLIARYLLSA